MNTETEDPVFAELRAGLVRQAEARQQAMKEAEQAERRSEFADSVGKSIRQKLAASPEVVIFGLATFVYWGFQLDEWMQANVHAASGWLTDHINAALYAVFHTLHLSTPLWGG